MDAASPALPELGDDRISAMEREVFGRISRERARARRRRGRALLTGGSALAILVVAAAITPLVTSQLSGATSTADGPGVAVHAEPGFPLLPADSLVTTEEAAQGGASGADQGRAVSDATVAGREIVASGSASVRVPDVARAADAVARDAEARGGFVESASLDHRSGTGSEQISPSSGIMIPYPGRDHIVVRVPATQLGEAMDALSQLGEVTASSVSRHDVTNQSVDLRARIASGEASVARLTQLMAEAESVADLIAAESALAERQAALEADQQQLDYLSDQVALSSLSVELTPVPEPVQARPAGFTDGIAAGWNGLVAALNGLVLALGFLLPWIAVAAVVALVVWLVVRLVRRTRRTTPLAEDGS